MKQCQNNTPPYSISSLHQEMLKQSAGWWVDDEDAVWDALKKGDEEYLLRPWQPLSCQLWY